MGISDLVTVTGHPDRGEIVVTVVTMYGALILTMYGDYSALSPGHT